jgi:hypothetical protein
MNNFKKIFFILNLIVLIVLIVIEFAIFIMLSNPKLIPNFLKENMHKLYEIQRHVIQLEDKMSKYDPELTYTLQPGKFVFSNY